jgi:hypothetical protein
MSRDYDRIAIIFIFFALIAASAFAQERGKIDEIYYEKDNRLYSFGAPDKWHFDIEDAQREGYSAMILPDSDTYYNYDMIIYVWIYPFQGAKTYREFITRDSLRFLKENPKIEFALTDSVYYDTLHYSIFLETKDPGAKYDVAFVGYIKSGDEIIIYQCDIRDRYYFSEAQARFREALSRFKVTVRE